MCFISHRHCFDSCLGQRGWFYVSVCVIAGQYDPVSAHINKKLLKPNNGHFISVVNQKAHDHPYFLNGCANYLN